MDLLADLTRKDKPIVPLVILMGVKQYRHKLTRECDGLALGKLLHVLYLLSHV